MAKKPTLPNVIVKLTDETRSNLLCSAIEGGSNYWYFLGEDADKIIQSVAPRDKETPYVTRMWAAIKAGKEIPIRDAEDEKTILGKISLVSICEGEQLMLDKQPRHFADILSENDDATTGDVWFQYAVMKEIVYG